MTQDELMPDDPLMQKIRDRRLAAKIAARRAAGPSGGHGFASPQSVPEAAPSASPDASGILGFKDAFHAAGRQVGLLGRDAAEAVAGVGGLMAPLAFGGSPMVSRVLPDAIANNVQRGLSALGVPRPAPGLEQNLHAGARGAMMMASGSPMVALSGATGGMAADVVQQAGGGPLAQMGAGMVGGFGPGLAERLLATRTAGARAGTLLNTALEQNANPPLHEATTVVPDRVQRSVALRVAGQGGPPADRLAAQARSVLDDAGQQERALTEAEGRDIATQRARGQAQTGDLYSEQASAMSALERQHAQKVQQSRQVEAAALGSARQRGERSVTRATAAAAGDPIADLFESTAGKTPLTITQAQTKAHAALQATGERVFGPLHKVGTIEPGEHSAALYDAINDPIVDGVLKGYLRQGEHGIAGESMTLRRDVGGTAPTVKELLRTYRMLGIRGTQAAINKGELNNVMMDEFFNARDRLGAALEQVVPGFREANAAYRADATRFESLAKGYGGALNPKVMAPDIRQQMADAYDAGGEPALEAYQYGQRRAHVDQLRNGGILTDVATERTLAGSHPAERTATAFPSDATRRSFEQDVAGRTRAIGTAQEGQRSAEEAVKGSFADQRTQIAGQSKAAASETALAYRARRDQAREASAEIIASIRASTKGARDILPQDRVRLAREIEAKAKQLQLPGENRLLRAGVESGAGARARSWVDAFLAIFGKKNLDPLATREILADFLLGDPPTRTRAATTMARDVATKRGAIRTGSAMGALVGAAQARDSTLP